MRSGGNGIGWMAGAVLTAVGAILFAISITALPIYYGSGGSVQAVILFRYTLLLVFCLGYVLTRRISLRLSMPELVAALGSGTIFGAGGLSAIAAYSLLPVSLGVLIFYLFPLLTVLMEAPLDRRMPKLGQILCLLAALGGIALALQVGTANYDIRGVCMSALGAFGVAVSFVWSGRKLGDAHPTVVNVFRSLCALGLALGFGGASGSGIGIAVSPSGLIAFAVAVTASVLAFICMFAGVQRIGATPAAMIMNVEPVFTMMFAALVLSESVTLPMTAGAAVIIGAVMVSQWLAAREAAQPQDAQFEDVPANSESDDRPQRRISGFPPQTVAPHARGVPSSIPMPPAYGSGRR